MFTRADAQEKDKLLLAVQDRPPYFIYKKNVTTPDDGVIYHLILKILNNANINFEFKNVPLIRSVSEIKSNKDKTCLPAAFKNKEREDIALFSKAYFQDKKTVIVFRKNDNKFKNYDKFENILKNNEIILLLKLGYIYGKYIDDLIFEVKKYNNGEFKLNNLSALILTSMNNTEMFYEIMNKKADYLIIGRNEGEYLFEQNPKFNQELEMKDLIDMPEGEKRYIMCAKMVGKQTMDKIDKEISKILK